MRRESFTVPGSCPVCGSQADVGYVQLTIEEADLSPMRSGVVSCSNPNCRHHSPEPSFTRRGDPAAGWGLFTSRA
ncbi:MAG: hypothetical protein ACLPVY_22280 [Acidimicrobiia bacterium]